MRKLKQTNDIQDKSPEWKIKLFSELFNDNPDRNIKLDLRLKNILEILKRYTLTTEEKEYLKKYSRERMRYHSGEISDENRFKKPFSLSISSIVDSKNPDIADMLAYLPPRILKEELGEAILFHVWNKHIYLIGDPQEFKIYEGFFRNGCDFVKNSQDYADLVRAKLATWRLHTREEPTMVLAAYLMHLKAKKHFNETNLTKEISSNGFSISLEYSRNTKDRGLSEKFGQLHISKDGKDITQEIMRRDLDENQLRQIRQGKDISGTEIVLFLDSPISIVLYYKGLPVAVAGFSLKNEETIYINQLQQIPYHYYDKHGRMTSKRVAEIVKNLDWKKQLTSLIEDFSKSNSYKKVEIEGSRNNRWVNREKYEEYIIKDGETIEIMVPHLKKEIARKIYDIFALNNGYKKQKGGNFIKNIKDT